MLDQAFLTKNPTVIPATLSVSCPTSNGRLFIMIVSVTVGTGGTHASRPWLSQNASDRRMMPRMRAIGVYIACRDVRKVFSVPRVSRSWSTSHAACGPARNFSPHALAEEPRRLSQSHHKPYLHFVFFRMSRLLLTNAIFPRRFRPTK